MRSVLSFILPSARAFKNEDKINIFFKAGQKKFGKGDGMQPRLQNTFPFLLVTQLFEVYIETGNGSFESIFNTLSKDKKNILKLKNSLVQEKIC